jgi:hypothetical protein
MVYGSSSYHQVDDCNATYNVTASGTRPPEFRMPGKQFNFGALLEDPVAGAAWDRPLRLIARFHCAMDVDAPVCFRVSRQFEYCWRLAVQTNKIDVAAYQKAARAWAGSKSSGHPPVAPFAVKHIIVSSRRDAKKNEHLCKGFEIARIETGASGPRESSPTPRQEAQFLGAIFLHVPQDAVLQGHAALFL